MINKKAFSEVYTILTQLEEKSIQKIPTHILDVIKENANITIDYIDKNVPLEELKLEKETKEILAIISYYYFCNDEERKKWKETLDKNEQKYQERLREKYNPDNIFVKKEEEKEKQKTEESSQTDLVIYKTDFFRRILNKIKEFFKHK